MKCRYCREEIEEDEQAVLTFAYWNKTPDACHSSCKKRGESEESMDCQTIDADCNDCKHYSRGVLEPKTISKLHKQNGIVVDIVFQPQVFIGGRCLKFDRPTLAFPNKWTGRECFEHRRGN